MYKIILFLAMFPLISFAQPKVTSGFLDSIVNLSMSKFPMAGVGIAVIEEGKATLLKGYGITSVETSKKVDANTFFAIASNSKAFTTTALGILVDLGKNQLDRQGGRIYPRI